MAYIGAGLEDIEKTFSTINIVSDTMVGDNSVASLVLHASQEVPEDVNNISVYFDGVCQRPGVDYTLNYKTVSFTTAPETGVKVTVLSYANEFLDVLSNLTVDTDNIQDGSVTDAKLHSGVTFSASDLTGTLPALDGSALTSMPVTNKLINDVGEPHHNVNSPTAALGTIWVNTTTGETYICIDITTGQNKWINIGGGTGNIVKNVAPTNATDNIPDMLENGTHNHTFSGGSDSDGNVTHYLVENFSSDKLSVTTAEVALNSAHEFITGDVDADTTVTFTVKTKDNDGAYSTGIVQNVVVINNQAPSIPNDPGTLNWNKNTSNGIGFAGSVDPEGDSISYVVDNITPNTYLSVSTAEMPAGQAHTFVTGNVPSNQNGITFRLRAKDQHGNYSAGRTVTVNISAIVYTEATGGSISTIGDYKVHTFTTSASGANGFNVTQVGTDNTFQYLVIAGGGSGGYSIAAGGGAGGLRNSYNNETSGGGGSSESALTLQASSYTVTIGAGGVCTNLGGGGNNSFGRNGNDTTFAGAGISAVTSIGGGRGGTGDASSTYQGNGGNGGSGGGSSTPYGAGTSGQGNPGTGTANQGYAGGQGNNANNSYPGAGGGAGSTGSNWNASGADGGAGVQSNIDGNNYYYAAGGGAGGIVTYGSDSGNGGAGGGGGGGNNVSSGLGTGGGSARNSGNNATTTLGGHGGLNTGSGGGGGGHYGGGGTSGQGGTGGSGIVIVRYKFQN